MKEICLFERKELKYLLTRRQRDSLLSSINSHIEPDPYPRYTICNLYMDTPDFRLIRRSMEKPVYKEKMRMRSYGKVGGEQDIFIELQKKYKGIVYKRRVKMPLARALLFLEGEEKDEAQIRNEIRYFIDQYEGLSRAMFISYEREAFRATDDSGLRLTIDKNILWRDEDLDLGIEPYGQSILEEDQLLMEIKCAGAMPLWLTGALSKEGIYRTSFSKYGKAYSQRLLQNMEKAAS